MPYGFIQHILGVDLVAACNYKMEMEWRKKRKESNGSISSVLLGLGEMS